MHDALSNRENALGLAPGSITLVATIETAKGLQQIESMSRAISCTRSLP